MASYYELEGKTVYIAGKMRGHELYNFPAFDNKSELLVELGARPVSPAELDRAHGFYETDELSGDYSAFARACIRRDVTAICDACDAVLVLGTDWDTSAGVAVEVALAKFLHLPVYYEEEMTWEPLVNAPDVDGGWL